MKARCLILVFLCASSGHAEEAKVEKPESCVFYNGSFSLKQLLGTARPLSSVTVNGKTQVCEKKVNYFAGYFDQKCGVYSVTRYDKGGVQINPTRDLRDQGWQIVPCEDGAKQGIPPKAAPKPGAL